MAEHGNSGKNYEARKCGLTSARERKKKKHQWKTIWRLRIAKETSENKQKRGVRENLQCIQNPDGCLLDGDCGDPTNKEKNEAAKPFGKLQVIKKACKRLPG